MSTHCFDVICWRNRPFDGAHTAAMSLAVLQLITCTLPLSTQQSTQNMSPSFLSLLSHHKFYACCLLPWIGLLVMALRYVIRALRWRHPQNRKYILYRSVASRREPSHGNMHKTLVKLYRAISELYERTDRQTNTHTHHSISHPSLSWENYNERRVQPVDLLGVFFYLIRPQKISVDGHVKFD